MKDDTARPYAHNAQEQQKRFDAFCRTYNQVRLHEAIGMQVPGAVYEKSGRQMPDNPQPIEYQGHVKESFVNHNGCVWIHNRSVYLGYLLKGQKVGIEELSNDHWSVCFGPIPLGKIKKTEKTHYNLCRSRKTVTYVFDCSRIDQLLTANDKLFEVQILDGQLSPNLRPYILCKPDNRINNNLVDLCQVENRPGIISDLPGEDNSSTALCS